MENQEEEEEREKCSKGEKDPERKICDLETRKEGFMVTVILVSGGYEQILRIIQTGEWPVYKHGNTKAKGNVDPL